jgi:uncharacterized membrane protein YphA (DoxX/SURF4 family)
MSEKIQRIVGWVLSGLLAAFLIFGSAIVKFTDFPGKEEMFTKLGLGNDTAKAIGVLEIIVTVLFLIPRTAFLGAILLTGYLGGAIFAHVRIGEPNYIMPIVMGVLVWVALALRQPVIWKLAIGKKVG